VRASRKDLLQSRDRFGVAIQFQYTQLQCEAIHPIIRKDEQGGGVRETLHAAPG
jgi:hypothetical protein